MLSFSRCDNSYLTSSTMGGFIGATVRVPVCVWMQARVGVCVSFLQYLNNTRY